MCAAPAVQLPLRIKATLTRLLLRAPVVDQHVTALLFLQEAYDVINTNMRTASSPRHARAAVGHTVEATAAVIGH